MKNKKKVKKKTKIDYHETGKNWAQSYVSHMLFHSKILKRFSKIHDELLSMENNGPKKCDVNTLKFTRERLISNMSAIFALVKKILVETIPGKTHKLSSKIASRK